MKLQVFHETSYRYEQPLRRSIQMLRMTPAKTQRQNVLNWQLDLPGKATQWTDAYGNLCHCLVLENASQDIVLRVFAPADDSQLLRVLAPGSAYLEVGPAGEHLWELRERLYQQPRPHAESRRVIAGLELESEQELSYRLELDRQLLTDLVAMTPFAHRGHREKRDSLLAIDQLSLQMAFVLRLFRKG